MQIYKKRGYKSPFFQKDMTKLRFIRRNIFQQRVLHLCWFR